MAYPEFRALVHDLSRNIREPEVAALEPVGQFLVVQAEQVQDGRVQVVDVYGILGNSPTDFIGFTDDLPAFYASTGKPHTK